MGKGLTGWLSPEGVFHPCEYTEHSKLANEIVEQAENRSELMRERYRGDHLRSKDEIIKLFKWIPMGIPSWGSQKNMDYLFISYTAGITESQQKWFADNRERLSEEQQEQLDKGFLLWKRCLESRKDV